MTLTSTEIIAIIVAAGAVAVNIITAMRMGNKVESIAQVTAKSLVETTALQGQVKEVHTLTNSNLSEVKADLKQAVSEIASMRETISDLKGEREKTAMATAFTSPTGVGASVGANRPARITDTPQAATVAAATVDEPMPVKIIANEPVPVDIQEKPKLKPKK